MGRWFVYISVPSVPSHPKLIRTTGYCDQILSSKLKVLVNASINNSNLEKEQTISYETFCEELDAGDAFTTSLFDVLVKELVDRKNRDASADRRLISSQTSKRLVQLATYRAPSRGSPQETVLEYLSAIHAEDDEESPQDLDDVPNSGPLEGIRVNDSLFEATASRGWTNPYYNPVFSSAEPSTSRTIAAIRRRVSASGSGLIRQPSLRRPPRSIRTSDFSEHALRRRASYRELLTNTDYPFSDSEDDVATPSSPRRRSPHLYTRVPTPQMMLPTPPIFSPLPVPDHQASLSPNAAPGPMGDPISSTHPLNFIQHDPPTPRSNSTHIEDRDPQSQSRSTTLQSMSHSLRRRRLPAPELLAAGRRSPPPAPILMHSSYEPPSRVSSFEALPSPESEEWRSTLN